MSFDYDSWLLKDLPNDDDDLDHLAKGSSCCEDDEDFQPQDQDCDYWKNVMAHY